MTLIITLPLPPTALSPNGRAHWRVVAKAKKARRQAAMLAVLSAVPAGYKPRFRTASMEIVRYSKTRRRTDSDNITGAEKSARDGIVDSGFLADDDQITQLPPRCLHDPENPRIEIHVTPTTPTK